MVQLLFQDTAGKDQRVDIGSKIIMGRSPEVDFKITLKGVSRKHACIERDGNRFILEDLGSTNGTFLNDKRINKPTLLKSGDKIRLGQQTLIFKEKTAPTVQPPTKTLKSLETEPLNYHEVQNSKGNSPQNQLPRKEGKFQLEKLLGRGGMGEIYLAKDLDSGQEVAVKFIQSHIGKKESFLELFHNREAALARQINHPNITRVYEHGITQDLHFISMEYTHGLNLQQEMKRRQLRISESIEILIQVSRGLAAAHRQGVIHSDIKPSNIIIGEKTDSSTFSNPDIEGSIELEDDILEFETEFPTSSESSDTPIEEGVLQEIQRRSKNNTKDLLLNPPYFERASERRFLEFYLSRAYQGFGQFVLIEGDSGTGKDRLVSEFLRVPKINELGALRKFDGLVLEFDASRIEGVPTLFRQLFPDKPQNETNQTKMCEAICEHLSSENAQPTILHVLGLGSLQPLAAHLLSLLGAELKDIPLLVLATVTTPETGHPRTVAALLSALNPVTKELFLRPLTEYQTQRFIQELFNDECPSSQLHEDLYRLSQGNFSRLLDVLKNFFDRHLLTIDSRSGLVKYRPNAREVELEEGKVQYEAYLARGKIEQKVLENAAFIGHKFFFDTLRKATEVEETALFFIMKSLVSARFLIEEERSWYRFTNRSFQKYLAESSPEFESPSLHRKIIRWLNSAPLEESSDLLILKAQHLKSAGETANAVKAFLTASNIARDKYDHETVQYTFHEILSIYRDQRRRPAIKKRIQEILQETFQREGNWYEILGKLASKEVDAWVKIVDFGISFRAISDPNEIDVTDGPQMGTPRYMAPERIQGAKGGPASDMFSLGIMFFEMITGSRPFPNLSRKNTMKANATRKIKLPKKLQSQLPEPLVDLLHSLLAHNPQERPSAEETIRLLTKLQYEHYPNN